MKSSISNSASVSVIVPLFNCEAYIAEAIESIRAQSHPVGEIIVVDDGSTDSGPEIAESIASVRVIRAAHSGPASTVNRGIEEATGHYLAFLDSDDTWCPGKIASQLKHFESDDPPDFVFGLVEQFISPELPESVKRGILCPKDRLPGFLLSAMLTPKATFGKIGLFAPDRPIGAFIDWFARGQESGLRSRLSEQLVLRRRLHENNLSRTTPDSRAAFPRIIKAALDRRRSQATGQ